jgi:hypothetical protein
MSNTEEADWAIAGLKGADFEGRALNVNEDRPKGQGGGGRENGGGFGRQRRGRAGKQRFKAAGRPFTMATPFQSPACEE